MEDWEQFFAEKSRRRAEKAKRRQRAARIRLVGAAAVLFAAVVAVSFLAGH
jgi:predicted nucleic acid-binding Zn ribbon protein